MSLLFVEVDIMPSHKNLSCDSFVSHVILHLCGRLLMAGYFAFVCTTQVYSLCTHKVTATETP